MVVELDVLLDAGVVVEVVVVWPGRLDEVLDVVVTSTVLLVLDDVDEVDDVVLVVVVVNGGPFTMVVESWTTPSASIISALNTPPSKTRRMKWWTASP